MSEENKVVIAITIPVELAGKRLYSSVILIANLPWNISYLVFLSVTYIGEGTHPNHPSSFISS